MAGSWSNVEFRFDGAAVLVTGGTGGIGAAVAAAFRDGGADVTITGTRESLSEYEGEGGGAGDRDGYRYLRMDVEDRASIDRAAQALDSLDVLVNSAGVPLFTFGLDEYKPDNFERAVTIHLTSVQRLAAAVAPKLSDSRLPGGGSILSMASMSSFFGIDAVPGYGAGKAGLVGLTRVLAVHWAKANIRVNALAVGMTHTGMTRAVMAEPSISDPMLARVPLGRHGDPGDVPGAALFLSSDAASWITGQTLCVDGGFSIAG